MFGDCYDRLVCAGDCFAKGIEAEGKADTYVCDLKGRCYYAHLGHLKVIKGLGMSIGLNIVDPNGHDLEYIEVSGAE